MIHSRWFLLLAISIIAFLINVDYTAVNLALIDIASDLNSSLNTIQWVLSSYVLTWAVCVIPASTFAERFQKKNVCLFGLFLFLIGSIFAGFATSAWQLILARAIQGLAGAIYIPMIYALLYLNFAEQERGRAIGFMSLGVGLGMALGPFIGGVLLSWINWRSIFFINLPIGIIAFSIIYFCPTAEKVSETFNKISKSSVVLLSMSLIFLLVVLNHSYNFSKNVAEYFGLLVFALLSLILFLVLQKKLKNPLISLSLFSNLPFSACCLGILIEQYAFSTLIVSIGLYLQKVMDFSVFLSSLIYLALTFCFALVSSFAGKWVDRIGLRLPTVLGLIILVLGSALFLLLSPTSSLMSISGVFIVIGIGMGLAFSGLNTGIIKTVSQSEVGSASSIFLLFALLGNSLAVTLTTIIYSLASSHYLKAILQKTNSILSALQYQEILNYVSNIGEHQQSLAQYSINQQLEILNHTTAALNYGIDQAVLLSLILCSVAIFLCFFLFKSKAK